jgi:hypothetical protein
MRGWPLLLLVACSAPRSTAGGSGAPGAVVPIVLPGGAQGIGFDDLGFAPGAHAVLAPAGATGNLCLIDPDTRAVTPITGFSTTGTRGGHDDGTTSADEGGGFLFAIDRTALRLVAIDEQTRAVVAQAQLASGPDYVRWIDATHEIWVTQPDEERIEVFAVTDGKPKHAAFIAVPGGPESLIVDAGRKRAFTHLWDGATVAIELASRAVGAPWRNGCGGSRGIALDAARGLLFSGCAEGKVTALREGELVGSVAVGKGVDVIAYNAHLAHLYVPSATPGTLTIVGVGAAGQLAVLGTVPTATGSHCAAADDRDTAWVCDVHGGRLLAIKDGYRASR